MNITLNNVDPNATITINLKAAGGGGSLESLTTGEMEFGGLESLENKADREEEMDFSACTGFDENFIGFKTPLPAMGTQLKRQVAKLKGGHGSFLLKYYNYTTVQHALRKVPVYSAINIDGDPVKRRDSGARKDDWLRDNRIDTDVQLNDAFYKKSGFDKGHMSRREDANWGNTEAQAFLSAQTTCMYTNACPQVPDLNRAIYGFHGLWGQLEQIVLEKGVEGEEGQSTRICVYNGPIFVSTDPVFNGVQIGLRFFKIIVWLNGKGKPKTTAFILSQEDLVSDIQFEELMYDEVFKEHQCSIPYLEELTGLSFTGIRDWDTFVNDGPGQRGVKSLDNSSMEALVTTNKS